MSMNQQTQHTMQQQTIFAYPQMGLISAHMIPRRTVSSNLMGSQSTDALGRQYTLNPTAKPISKAYCNKTTPWSSNAKIRRHTRVIPT